MLRVACTNSYSPAGLMRHVECTLYMPNLEVGAMVDIEQDEQSEEQTAFASFFGAAIAIILLILWGATLLYMIKVVQCEADTACTTRKVADITSGMIFVSTTIGGLVSALVVAVLAITVPGKGPGASIIAEKATKRAKRIADILASLYVSAWVVIGLAALVYGVMLYPDISETLNTIGTMWLGIAVAAGYSYFGIKQAGT